jgi:CelD/BcsL family acetyltransferase involved in cellulose biosynthesis
MPPEKNKASSFGEQKLHDCSDLTERYAIVDFEGEQAFHTLRDEWEKLWWLSEDATESQTWQWQYLYWKHLAPKTHPVIIVARDSHGVCAALAAFFICRDQLSWVSKAAFLGDKKPDYHVIVARPNLPETVGIKILEHFAIKFRKRVPYFELTNVPENSYTGTILRQFLVDKTTPEAKTLRWQSQTYAVPLPKTVEEYLKQLGPRSRRDFRYDRKKLCNEFSVDFRVYSALDNLDEVLDAIEIVDRARWGANSLYAVTSQRSFERSIARAFCEMGIYRGFVLYLNGKPSAFVTAALVRNSLKLASIGYDRSVPGKLSIGKVTNFYAIEYCIQRGYREYDLTRGPEEYKKWLGAIPSTNLHVRHYRTRFDELVNSGGKRIVSFLRDQIWLRKIYHTLLRR